jgi:hypothetical protein
MSTIIVPARLTEGGSMGSISRRVLIVVLSIAVYAICLTQTAYVTSGAYFAADSLENSAISQLLWGWMAVPVALFLFFYPNPLVVVSVAVTSLLAWKHWYTSAAVAGCITVVLMWKCYSLGLASWLANPLLWTIWIFYLLDRIRIVVFLAGIVLLLMVGFLSIDQVPFGLKGDSVPITAYGAGYWLWIASAVIMLVAAGGEYLARGVTHFEKQ